MKKLVLLALVWSPVIGTCDLENLVFGIIPTILKTAMPTIISNTRPFLHWPQVWIRNLTERTPPQALLFQQWG
jgi:hypothetical protein